MEPVRGTAGGNLEPGTSSAETVGELAVFSRDFKPALETKHSVDMALVTCFHPEESEEWTVFVNDQGL